MLLHLQYCLTVWGYFEAGHNRKRRVYHADLLFARFGVLKVEELYRQQVRVHA